MKKYSKQILSIVGIGAFLVMAWASDIGIENQKADNCDFLPSAILQDSEINIKVLDQDTKMGIPNVQITLSYYSWSKRKVGEICEFELQQRDVLNLGTDSNGECKLSIDHFYYSKEDYIEVFIYAKIETNEYKNEQDKFELVRFSQLKKSVTFKILKVLKT